MKLCRRDVILRPTLGTEASVTPPCRCRTRTSTFGPLAQYVHERKLVSLSDAIAKTSYLPAKYLQDAVPQLQKKGRLQVGMDADVVVFDPNAVRDRATYEHPNQTSDGMRYVIVNGIFVINNGKLDTSVFPGHPIHRAVIQ